MIVLTLSSCPATLRGDVTKWLTEIDTGVFVGQASARVRDELWKRVCKHIGNGRAVMAFTTRNEQGYSYYTCNTPWKTVDYDGIVLIQQPLPVKNETQTNLENEKQTKKNIKAKDQQTKESPITKQPVKEVAKPVASKTTRRKKELPYQEWPTEKPLPFDFTVLDLETTGLDPENDQIIEIACVRYRQGSAQETYQNVIQISIPLPDLIVKMTGITDDMLNQTGISLSDAIRDTLDFVGGDVLIGHNIAFDISFLKAACDRLGIEPFVFRAIDTVFLSRTKLMEQVPNYRLETLLQYFHLASKQMHRAFPDAKSTAELYLKLNEI